CGKHPRT
uniref:Uncharacterized protein n=1 Tax=Solanum lycopersicum TaxID=4081 RepID=A0A3Q7HLS7_SOLLC